MPTQLIKLEDFKDLKPIECPTRGMINFPCVICKECDIGAVMLTFSEGVLIETTVNSVLIHLSLDIQDNQAFEKQALKALKANISKIVPYVQKGDWEEGDLTIMITDEKKDDETMIKHINNFLVEFQIEWRKLAIEANRMVRDWSERIAKQISLKYFKELSDQRR